MKISVVTACYNSALYIEDTIKSIVEQTYSNWELVIVDDCSTDDSLKAIKKCVKKFNIEDKAKVVEHDKNHGYGRTLRDAIENSSGELVAIVDSDDALARKDVFEIIIKYHIKYPKASMTYSNYIFCDEKLKVKRVCSTVQIKDSYLKSLLSNVRVRISHLKVFKRKFYDMTEGVDPTIRRVIDKDLVLKLEEVGKLIHIDKDLYYFRNHPQQLGYIFSKAEGKKIKKKIFIDAKERRQKR